MFVITKFLSMLLNARHHRDSSISKTNNSTLFSSAPLPPNADWKLLSTKELAEAEQIAISKRVGSKLDEW